ncbi:MAG: hypothetical protein U9Q99_01065, partial [Nanoarchaeota archaeon]|nr:hypothetical protein [Nanoarchaeota archaeon]
MNKKAQVTIFIILSLIIIVVVGGYFTFKNVVKTKQNAFDVFEIQTFVKNCVEKKAEPIILQISENGGYYLLSNFSTFSGIPIYYSNNKFYTPSLEEIENEISNNLKKQLLNCTDDFKAFEEFQIVQEIPYILTEIKEDKILIDVYYPLKISKENSVVELEDFGTFNFNIPLGKIYYSVLNFLEVSNFDFGTCLSCIFDISVKDKMKINMFNYND